jgi:hypothetical protein
VDHKKSVPSAPPPRPGCGERIEVRGMLKQIHEGCVERIFESLTLILSLCERERRLMYVLVVE